MQPIQLPSHFKSTHQTSGLPGFPAIDVFAPAGSRVASPLFGKIIKLSGHPPTPVAIPGGPYGWTSYLETTLGVFFITHFGTRSSLVKIGATLPRGTILGTVADYAKATHGKTPSHIHLGFHKGPWHP